MIENKADLKYMAVYEWIIDNIKMGKFQKGDKLPSENMLCQKFSISRQTVRNAIDKLAAEEKITRVKGSGTFVNANGLSPKSKTVGVFLTFNYDYIFSRVLRGLEPVLTREGYGIDLGFSHNRIRNEKNYLERMIETNVAGMIVEGVKTAFPSPNVIYYKKIEEMHIPVVFIHNYYSNFACNAVLMRDEEYAYNMTKMLIDAGHRKIAGFFKYDDVQGIWRYFGYVRALCEANIEVDESHIRWFGSSSSQTKIAIDLFMDTIAAIDPFMEELSSCTAFVCYNDLTLMEFLKRFEQRNIKVPDDISVVSFDDTMEDMNNFTGVTSAVHPKETLGKRAAERLIGLIKGTEDPEKRLEYMPPQIHVRDSIKTL